MSRVGIALLVTMMVAPLVEAHQLDEYLQATRLDISRDRIGVEIDLTAGIAIAPQILALIDSDADGDISAAEMDGYARRVLREVSLSIDGRVSPLALTGARFPAWSEVRDGMGTIRIEAVTTAGVTGGSHQIAFENGHQPATSVYLVNALKPSTHDIAIGSQRRDPQQRRFDLDVEVSGMAERLAWCAAASLLLVWYALRRRRARAPAPLSSAR
jgi:hypothetical protein